MKPYINSKKVLLVLIFISLLGSNIETKFGVIGTNPIYAQTNDNAKFHLTFDSPTGYHRQILIGTNEYATNSFDFGFDAPIEDIAKEDMFWCFEGGKYVIQGINDFNENQNFSIGIVIAEAGKAKICVDNLVNFKKEHLFLFDKETGKSHDLMTCAFEIDLEPGEYLDRFSLMFKPSLLSLNDVDLVDGIHLFMNNSISELQIKKIVDTEILEINVYNYLGQTIRNWTKNLDNLELSLPIEANTGVYIVNVNTIDGLINKKIIIN